MSNAELEAWLQENPLIVVYMLTLFAGSLIAFISLLHRFRTQSRIGRKPVSPWPLSALDFGLFAFALFAWFILSGAILMQVASWIHGKDFVPGNGTIILGGYLLQGGMLYLFLRFRFHFRSPQEGSFSPRLMNLARATLLGFYAFLASLPLVYGTGLLWTGFLELLRQSGIDIDLPIQDAVLLFTESKSPLQLAALIVLAVVVAPFVEELVFRAGIYRYLKGRTRLPLALLISAALFGVVHGNLHSLPGLIAVGVCLGLAYEFSGNIRVPMIFHACFNLNSIIWIFLLPDGLV
jgi:membrane protease YdiL (CAAX protease family)